MNYFIYTSRLPNVLTSSPWACLLRSRSYSTGVNRTSSGIHPRSFFPNLCRDVAKSGCFPVRQGLQCIFFTSALVIEPVPMVSGGASGGSGRHRQSKASGRGLKGHFREVHIRVIIIRWLFSSFPLAESPPRDLQITAYK